MDITNVNFVQDNLFEITIHVVGSQTIPLKYLHSLKIIGVDGPQGTIQLYGKNENTYLIDDPTDFTSTFKVYGNLKNGCQWWLPNFQIQFEYLQGEAAQYSSTWIWGTSSFDLSTGCNNYDSQGNSQTDFPGFYWTINLPNECSPKYVSSLSKSSSYIETISKSSSSAPIPSSGSFFNSSVFISSSETSFYSQSLTTTSFDSSTYSATLPPSSDFNLVTSSATSNKGWTSSTVLTYTPSDSTSINYLSDYTSSKVSSSPSSKDDIVISSASLISNQTESVTTAQMSSSTITTLDSIDSTIYIPKDSTLSSNSKTLVQSVPTVTATSLYSVSIQVNSGIKRIQSLIGMALVVFLSQLL
ncbi:hypothetical protein C6P45_003155 [Maudiozyma exigua]|uniref:Flo11 domain-containing protein n=1 Tax=Maudiozyma exigua TaxID=34358 RepID=A0A9P7B2L7_MAUEX|nr:hypothetical protein C6P45_003155 [Kazachstania exigua]